MGSSISFPDELRKVQIHERSTEPLEAFSRRENAALEMQLTGQACPG